jgi:hypothetical protein
MSGLFAAETTLPTGALFAVIALAIVELVLVVFCIVDIVRRPAVLGGRKWVWIVFIVFFNLIGSIVYLAVGRVAPPEAEAARDEAETMTRGRAESAADLLYGPATQPAGGDAGDAGAVDADAAGTGASAAGQGASAAGEGEAGPR